MSGSKITSAEPAPDGDTELVLRSKDTPTTLRVSSAVLSCASLVFTALLSPNFAEGSATPSDGVKTVSLPDDDPEAMAWICRALHSHTISYDVSHELLEQISVLCDKYDLAGALRGKSELCLQFAYPCATPVTDPSDAARFIFIVFAFGAHASFYRATLGFLANMLPLDKGLEILETFSKKLPQRLFGKEMYLNGARGR